MKERPILFQGAMVRALLDGSKTQTRRAAKFKAREEGVNLNFSGMQLGHYMSGRPETGFVLRSSGAGRWDDRTFPLHCPYGQPGDRLWVRETFFAYGRWETRYSEKKKRDEWHFIDMTLECDRVYQYAADNPDVPLAKGRGPMPGWWKRPAIFMPRAACRAVPEIVSVRVDRLNDISEADAYAEGVEPEIVPVCCGEPHHENHGVLGVETYCCGSPIEDEKAVPAYEKLWESINGAGSWAANPWVWCVEFRRVQP